ncbi:MAG: hypothetical protein KKH28_04795 [Elusimicrobia bacterium]|nr:hypothetical protein [Elusimicrobiota bacterium]
MNKVSELKALLDRLKGEVGRASGPGLPPEPAPGYRSPVTRHQTPDTRHQSPVTSHQSRFAMSARPEFPRPERPPAPAGANLIWSENKETMLFGMLASLVAALGGILAALDYLILIGAVSFMFFSFIMVFTLFGYYRNFSGKSSGEAELTGRLDALSRKVESLVLCAGAAQSSAGGFRGRDKDLEQKVEELRILVKSLAKAVEERE